MGEVTRAPDHRDGNALPSLMPGLAPRLLAEPAWPLIDTDHLGKIAKTVFRGVCTEPAGLGGLSWRRRGSFRFEQTGEIRGEFIDGIMGGHQPTGLPFPLLARITWPTKKPNTFPLPPPVILHLAGWPP